MTHSNIIVDSDAFFEIDPITRSIKNLTPSKISVMQNDHNSERFTFSIPRYVEGHDMSTSDKVEVHYININSATKEQSTGIYEMPDLKIDSDDTEKVTCSWLLSCNATKYAGKLSFLVRFVCLDGNEIEYAWNTAVFEGISVGQGLNVSDEILEEYVDIIEAWKTQLQAEINVWVDETVAEQVDVQQIQTNKVNIETLEADQNVLKARVDNLLTSETVDGELIDVRVGYDGKTYGTAGEAVREQLKDINEKHIEDISRISTSEIDIDEIQGTMIVPTAEGESIHLTDSAKAKFRGLKLFGKTEQFTTTGKNLLTAHDMYSRNPQYTTETIDGRECVKFTDGLDYKLENIPFKENTVYTLSMWAKSTIKATSNTNDSILGAFYYSDGTYEYLTIKRDKDWQFYSKSSNPSKTVVAIGMKSYNFTNWLYVDVNTFQLEENSTYTDYEPYTGGLPSPSPEYPQEMNSPCPDGSVGVDVFGKNLIPYPYFDTTMTQNGITFTDNGDGTITVNGTATDTANFLCVNMGTPIPIKAGKYIISGCPANGGANTFEFAFGWRENVGDTRQLLYEQGSGIEYTFEKDGYIDFICVARTGVTANNAVFKPMLRVADITDGKWEAYKEPQSLVVQDIMQSGGMYVDYYGLFGIPVTSGGNYTDANGQQWVCDEIDLARGVYVQRIKQYWLTGDESWAVSGIQTGMKEGFTRYDCSISAPPTSSNDSLWSHFQYKGTVAKDGYGAWVHPGSSTKVALRIVTDHASVDELKAWLADKSANSEPVTVLYILAKPIETPLSDEEIEAFKALHTNKTVTTIFNDENAWMAAEYVADPKTYIDNKFLELEKTILNTTT